MKTAPVTAWELRYSDSTTDKFYRLYVVGENYWVRQWGRTGSTGVFAAARTPKKAGEAAKVQGAVKLKAGYTRDTMRTFEIPQSWVATLKAHGPDLHQMFTEAEVI